MTREELKRIVDAYAEASQAAATAEDQGTDEDARWWAHELERRKEAAHKAIDAFTSIASSEAPPQASVGQWSDSITFFKPDGHTTKVCVRAFRGQL